jgi:hypothetical protein
MPHVKLSIDLMMEAGRRAQPDGQWWTKSTGEQARAAAQQAGYCLDAPDEIPTGRVLWIEFAEDLAGTDIETVPREPAHSDQPGGA